MQNRSRKPVYLALLSALAIALVGFGCAPARQAPEPRTDVTPAPTAQAPVLDFTALQDRFNQFIKGVGVPGYRRADTIVVGNTALIGLELDRTAAGAPAAGGAAAPGTAPGAAGTAPGTTGTTGTTGATTGAPGATTTPGAAGTNDAAASARMVADRVVAGNLGVSRALVTVDPQQVARIQRLVQDFRSGVPASDRIDEIAALVKAVRGAPAATTPSPSR